jgi:hypothetical protein
MRVIFNHHNGNAFSLKEKLNPQQARLSHMDAAPFGSFVLPNGKNLQTGLQR